MTLSRFPLERDELVDDRKCDCTGGGDQQEEQQASEDGHCLFLTPLRLFMRP
jgi:hypothetical protein